jgi:Mg2+ and Co2+ transporter CorA
VKVCPDGSVLLTVKTATTMDLQMFEKNSIYANAQTLHLNEPTVAGIADSSSCSPIAVLKSDSGAISILEKTGGQYSSTLDDIVVGSELEKVMVNEDMDIIVARTTDAGSKVYKFDMCSEKYEKIHEFDNTHEGLTIGGGYIVSKTESGLELQSYTS